ncbi:hypothetical protein QM565_03625 [Geitlerinema splendidum]|nr:hypothetical protein [Geitlerinema splendidum]
MVVKMLNKLLFSALVSLIMVNSTSFAQGTTDEFLEGGGGRISSSHVKQMLESPDKKLTEGGRTFKLVNPHISKGLLDEMAKSNETISGTWSSGSGDNVWRFSYSEPGTYDDRGELIWSPHTGHVGENIDFTIIEENPSQGFHKFSRPF